LERTNPPANEEDDKIIRITNNEYDEDPFFTISDVKEGKISVHIRNDNHTSILKLTTFYGGSLKEETLSVNEVTDFNFSFEKTGVYWLKIIQDGRIISKLIRVDEAN
jgi:hypothetical protein